MQHSSAEPIEGVERGNAPGHATTTTAEYDAARLRSDGGSVRAHPVDDAMYPTKVSTDHDSLRKADIESNDTSEAKVPHVHESEVVRSDEEEEPGTIKKFIRKHRKAIRVGIHVLIGTVMTG